MKASDRSNPDVFTDISSWHLLENLDNGQLDEKQALNLLLEMAARSDLEPDRLLSFLHYYECTYQKLRYRGKELSENDHLVKSVRVLKGQLKCIIDGRNSLNSLVKVITQCQAQ